MSMLSAIPASIKFRLVLDGIKSLHTKIGRSYTGYSILAIFKTPKPKDDFRSIYIASLYNYVATHNKPNLILKLFSKKSIENAFQNDYNGTGQSVHDQILLEIAINEEFSEFNINVENEVRLFKREFNKVVISVLSPTQSYIQSTSNPSTDETFIINALDEQVKSQIIKQQNTKKYIPNTFIELSQEKDRIRFFAHPVLFTKRYYEMLNRMDFRHFNKKLKDDNKTTFDFEPNKFHNQIISLHLNSYAGTIASINNHLGVKVDWIKALDDRSGNYYTFRSKIEDCQVNLEYPTAKILLITENAGQGKTNLVCDLSDKCFQKKGIPHVFITGYEINSDDIPGSLLNRIFPLKEIENFRTFLTSIDNYCGKIDRPFVLIIDGLNETINAAQLAQNIEPFLSKLIKNNFVKIILTCRTEYFEKNFSTLLTGSLSTQIKHITSINDKFDEKEQKKLFDAYLRHFEITIKNISPYVKHTLLENFLLLRIFSEVYCKSIDLEIHDIYKEDLYHKYFELKCDEITRHLQQSGAHDPGHNINIRKFLTRLTKYMVDNNSYANVPLEEIVETGEDIQMYTRFLDENILIKRDPLAGQNQLFGNHEVVNYTFDEFRDYTITKYILENYYQKEPERFETFITTSLDEKSPILEGCSSFLFYFARKNNDEKLDEILKQQTWYETAFIKCVFSLANEDITESDISKVQEILNKDKLFKMVVDRLIYLRNDTTRYSKLNIQLLFEWLRGSSDEQYKRFTALFSNNMFSHGKINHEELVKQLEELFDDEREKTHPHLHNLYELLIYIFPLAPEAEWLFERYHFRYQENATEMLKKAEGAKNIISENVKEFKETNDLTD